MDYSYCYFVNYMYVYALTTNFLFIFSRVLYMLPTKTYRLNI